MSESWEQPESRGSARMKHATTHRLYTYWDTLRSGRPAPDRRELAPAELGPILSDTFILEARNTEDYAYRLAGTRICTAFGRELKGENWLTPWAERDGEALGTLLRCIVADGAGAVVRASAFNSRGQSVPLETLMLPLVNEGSGFSRILGSTVALDLPYWFGARAIDTLCVTGLELLWPGDTVVEPEERKPHPVFERMLPLRRRRHLALYEGGRAD